MKAILLKKYGSYVATGGTIPRLLKITVFGKLISLFSSKKLKVLSLEPDKGLDQFSTLVEKGQIRPVFDGSYEFKNIPKLIEYFNKAKHLGKSVVKIEKNDNTYENIKSTCPFES